MGHSIDKTSILNSRYDTSYSLELTPNVVIAQALATSHFTKKVMKKVSYYEVSLIDFL